MNIITRKKEIMEVIEKLNEATKLANDALALTGLKELENSIESQKMFNQDTIIVDGVEYVKTDKEPKKGDYVVFEKDIMSLTKANNPYLMVGDDVYQVTNKYGLIMLNLRKWAEYHKVDFAVFTNKLTRKFVINKAVDYLYDYYYVGGGVNPSCYVVNGEECSMYLTHNAVKRTSNLILKGTVSKKVHHHQTIRCHPDDVYNETIGAAILIARLRNDSKMVELFENAPQPTEIKEGMYIDILVDNILVYEKIFWCDIMMIRKTRCKVQIDMDNMIERLVVLNKTVL